MGFGSLDDIRDEKETGAIQLLAWNQREMTMVNEAKMHHVFQGVYVEGSK